MSCEVGRPAHAQHQVRQPPYRDPDRRREQTRPRRRPAGDAAAARPPAAGDGGEDLTRPWVYLRLGKEQLDDTLQRLFDASYTSPQPFKPTPEQRARLLGQVNSVILLDDLIVGAAEVDHLVANLAGASVLVASTRPVLGRHGMSVN